MFSGFPGCDIIYLVEVEFAAGDELRQKLAEFFLEREVEEVFSWFLFERDSNGLFGQLETLSAEQAEVYKEEHEDDWLGRPTYDSDPEYEGWTGANGEQGE